MVVVNYGGYWFVHRCVPSIYRAAAGVDGPGPSRQDRPSAGVTAQDSLVTIVCLISQDRPCMEDIRTRIDPDLQIRTVDKPMSQST